VRLQARGERGEGVTEGLSGKGCGARRTCFSTEDSQALTPLVLDRHPAAPRRTTGFPRRDCRALEGRSPATARRVVDVHLL
jgi:hypothetical protein